MLDQRTAARTCAAIAALCTIGLFVVDFSRHHSWHLSADRNYYELLADAFTQGQFHLRVDPVLWDLPDANLYRSRYYVYFGPAPAVVIAAINKAWGALSSQHFPDRLYLFVAAFLQLYFLGRLILLFRSTLRQGGDDARPLATDSKGSSEKRLGPESPDTANSSTSPSVWRRDRLGVALALLLGLACIGASLIVPGLLSWVFKGLWNVPAADVRVRMGVGGVFVTGIVLIALPFANGHLCRLASKGWKVSARAGLAPWQVKLAAALGVYAFGTYFFQQMTEDPRVFEHAILYASTASTALVWYYTNAVFTDRLGPCQAFLLLFSTLFALLTRVAWFVPVFFLGLFTLLSVRRSRIARRLLLLLVAAGAIAFLGTIAYNRARFGAFMEFGWSYQIMLVIEDLPFSRLGRDVTDRLGDAMYLLLAYAGVMPATTSRMLYDFIAPFNWSPFLLWVLVAPYWRKRQNQEPIQFLRIIWVVLLSALFCLVAVPLGAIGRYNGDLIPWMLLLAASGYLCSGVVLRKLAVVAVVWALTNTIIATPRDHHPSPMIPLPEGEYARQGLTRMYAPPTGPPNELRPTSFYCTTPVSDSFRLTSFHLPGRGRAKGEGPGGSCAVKRAMNFVFRTDPAATKRTLLLDFTTSQPTLWGVRFEDEFLPDLHVGRDSPPLEIPLSPGYGPNYVGQLFVYLKEIEGEPIASNLSYKETVGWFRAFYQE